MDGDGWYITGIKNIEVRRDIKKGEEIKCVNIRTNWRVFTDVDKKDFLKFLKEKNMAKSKNKGTKEVKKPKKVKK
jgi:hypothetical protein